MAVVAQPEMVLLHGRSTLPTFYNGCSDSDCVLYYCIFLVNSFQSTCKQRFQKQSFPCTAVLLELNNSFSLHHDIPVDLIQFFSSSSSVKDAQMVGRLRTYK